jgi:sulfite exporter TauE/SafE
MLLAFFLGLMGSLGHCVGMCSGVMLLLGRRGVTSGWRLIVLQAGRITTYGVLGLVAGALGGALGFVVPGLRQLQGVLALTAAWMAVYLALALLGKVRSPEVMLSGLTRRWGDTMRRLTVLKSEADAQPPMALTAFGLGLIWGLLPCGLVLTALLTAATTGTPLLGALTMLAFGVGTWPTMLGIGWLARRELPKAVQWPRTLAAVVVLAFGVQMTLRGMAAWGVVSHLHLGGVMVW